MHTLPPSPADSPLHPTWRPQGNALHPEPPLFDPPGAPQPLSLSQDEEDPIDAHYSINPVTAMYQSSHSGTTPHTTSTQYGRPPPPSSTGLTMSEMEALIDKYKLDSQRRKVYAFQQVRA